MNLVHSGPIPVPFLWNPVIPADSGAIPPEFNHSGAIPVESGHSSGIQPFQCHSCGIWSFLRIPVPFLRIPVPFRQIPVDSGRNLWGTKKYSLLVEI